MTRPVTREAELLGSADDDARAAVALAADPDLVADDDAVCMWDVTGRDATHLLPEWYMPSPMGGAPPLRGWRRQVVLLVVVSLLVITAFGLCNTYGQLRLG